MTTTRYYSGVDPRPLVIKVTHISSFFWLFFSLWLPGTALAAYYGYYTLPVGHSISANMTIASLTAFFYMGSRGVITGLKNKEKTAVVFMSIALACFVYFMVNVSLLAH